MNLKQTFSTVRLKRDVLPAVIMLAVSAACMVYILVGNRAPTYHVDPHGTPVVMTVDGDQIHANEYAAYFQANKVNMESQYTSYGLDASKLWSDAKTGPEMVKSVRQSTEQMLTEYHVIIHEFQDTGLQLMPADIKEIRDYKANLVKQYGGADKLSAALNEQGLTEQMFDNSMVVSAYVKKLNDYYFGKNGKDAASEDAITAKFKQDYIQAKHILISTVDSSTGKALTGDKLAAKQKLAQEVLKKVQSGGDFDALIKQYGEDPGMSSSPKGYIFRQGEMVPEFYNAAKALKENQVSGIVKSDYGYHIIKRLPLDTGSLDETNLSQTGTFRNLISKELTGKDFTTILEDWTNHASVQKNESEIDKITVDNAAKVAMTGVKTSSTTSSSSTSSSGSTASSSASSGTSSSGSTSSDTDTTSK